MSLDTLLDEISRCRICRDAPTQKSHLPHEPRPVVRLSATSRIAIVGQAPGTRVHASGVPFDDPSGDRLRDWMAVSRDEFYDVLRIAVIPMGFCFPGLDAKGGDLGPRKECAPAWRDRVMAEATGISLTLVIGLYAQAWHLGKARKRNLTETVNAWRDYYDPEASRRILPLPHPSWRNNAWIRKNPWFETELLPVLQRDVRLLLDG
jgi:uracil-DNA glycosylase